MKITAILFLLSFAAAGAGAAEKAIYGEDNRQDYWSLSKEHRKLADSVVSIWLDTTVRLSPDKTFYDLEASAINEGPSVYCPGMRFEDQKSGSFCSGSFIGEDLVLTAGHCVRQIPDYDCEHMRFVFGFHLQKNGASTERIAANDVYSCREVLARHVDTEIDGQNPKGGDYALIRLDREVKGKKPLRINQDGEVKKGTPLFLMGYPAGLPLKMAADASVRNTDQKDGYFMANLDAFGGNSGSPVFNSVTRAIEGILTAGDTDLDYRENGGCFFNHVNPQDGGRGEDVTKISLLRDLIAQSRRQDHGMQIKNMPAPDAPGGGSGIRAEDINFDLRAK